MFCSVLFSFREVTNKGLLGRYPAYPWLLNRRWMERNPPPSPRGHCQYIFFFFLPNTLKDIRNVVTQAGQIHLPAFLPRYEHRRITRSPLCRRASVCPPFEHSESSEWLSRSVGVSVVPLEANKTHFQFAPARDSDATPSSLLLAGLRSCGGPDISVECGITLWRPCENSDVMVTIALLR